MACGIKFIIEPTSGPVVVYLPLEQLHVRVTVVDVSATITLTQTFWQCSATPTSQTKYVFPVPAKAAVCGFEMRTEDGRTVKAVAQERGIAKKEHEQAVARGQLTGLVEYVQDDVFIISLGCLPPQQIITTELTYVMDLMDDERADHIRLQLPVCIGQRYGVLPAGMVAASSIPPERVRISTEVYMRGALQSITSPSHPIAVVSSSGDIETPPGICGQSAQFASPDFLEQDFVLSIKADGLDAARCFAERTPDGSVALQFTVTPHVKLPSIPSQEYIFLVDRSGSMEGDRIDTAKRALVMLLRALPRKGTWFNIFSFGSSCASLWKESVVYDESTLEQATKHVDDMNANYGGTEIRRALQQVFDSRSMRLPTSCFLLTDGEAWDTQGTLAMVKQTATNAKPEAPLRVFTLGIGATTSTELCEGISRASNGACLMAVSSESIVGKCSKLVKASRSEILRDVAIEWGAQVDPRGQSTDLQKAVLRQSPEIPPLIYDGIRFVVFALINDPKYTIPAEITVRAKRVGTGEISEFSVPVQELNRAAAGAPPLVHTLAARRMIMDLEDQDRDNISEDTKAAIVHLGEQYQLACRFTSFIAVEDEHQEKLGILQAADADLVKFDGDDDDMGCGLFDAYERPYTPSTALPPVHTTCSTPAAIPAAQIFQNCTAQKAAKPEDPVMLLIRQQSFNGSFPTTDTVKNIFGSNAVLEASKNGVEEIVWVTILAIAYLQKYRIDQPELLDALVEKATEFVKDSASVDFDALLRRAVSILSSVS